jgi:membrane-bound ClpP family serine protease
LVYTPGSITKWSRVAIPFAIVALIVPDGAYRWAALSIAGVLLIIAATRVPRQAWGAHKVLLAALGCVIAAFVAAELLPLSSGVTAWTVGVTGGVFVGVVVFSAVRLIRRRRDGGQGP